MLRNPLSQNSTNNKFPFVTFRCVPDVDIVPYDMTERLKEVNRALIEDPTPAECDRAITIRFREVIADYHSPRDEFPSGEPPC